MAQAFIEDHANTCCWRFFVARLLRKSQIATYFCLIKACRAYGGRRRVALGISKSSHIISEHLGQPLWAGKEMSCCHFTNGDFGPQYCSWGVCEAMWTRFSLPQRRRDSWKRMKVDESDYTDYTQKHCPRSKLSLWCRAKAPQCHQRWTGYITSRDSLDDKPTNSYKFTQIHSCLPTFCIRTWLGILVVPSEVKKGKRLRESWAKNGIDHKKLCY